MSARVYLTSGRWVDVPGATVAGLVDEVEASAPDDFFVVAGEQPTAAFRIGAVEAVIAI